MSLNNFTQYQFSHEHGITGTLAADPTFGETKEGNEYAKFVLYCKAADKANGGNQKSKCRGQRSDVNDLPLIAYGCVFDEGLFSEVENLKKGYFVNFHYDSVTILLGENEETDGLRVKASFVANDLEVRHIPNKAKVKNLDRLVTNNDEKRKKARLYRKK